MNEKRPAGAFERGVHAASRSVNQPANELADASALRKVKRPKARAPRPMLAANSPVTSRCDSAAVESDLLSELLILPDGRVLVHNLTPAFADMLHELKPDDGQIRPRARRITRHAPRTTPHTP
jgi:hypothetical protein